MTYKLKKTNVSLISGCLNGEKFIKRSFDSVLNQTYTEFEFIFVDDGSTDKTLEIANTYIPKFKERNIDYIIIHQKNIGYYPTTGIKHSKGKYICTLDVDDFLMPNSIEERVIFLENNIKYAGVRTNGYEVSEINLDCTSKLFITNEIEKKNINIFEDLLYGKTNNWAGSYMIKTSELLKHFPDKNVPNNRFGQNLQILMPVAYKNKIGFIDEPLMKYIRNDVSFTMSADTFTQKLQQAKEFKKIRKSILFLLRVDNKKISTNLDQVYYKIYLNIAMSFSERNEFNRYYKLLQQKSITDIVNYYNINNKWLQFYLFRIIKFSHKVLKKLFNSKSI